MFAAMFGRREVVDLLILAGADPDSQTLLGISARKIASFTEALRSLSSIFSS